MPEKNVSTLFSLNLVRMKFHEKSKTILKRIVNNLYAFVNVHGWYYNLVNLLPIEDKLDVMTIMWKLGS